MMKWDSIVVFANIFLFCFAWLEVYMCALMGYACEYRFGLSFHPLTLLSGLLSLLLLLFMCAFR